MYAREINGQEFTFGVSGKLIRNVLVMYDRQTDSLWSQLLGEAVEGEMQGTRLEFLPSWMTTWEQWKTMHPDTEALHKGRRGKRDTYDGYYLSGATGVIGETFRDDRLYVKEFVIGAELDDVAIAYPFSALNEEPLINDVVDGHPLLVVFDPETAAAAVFNRRVAEQTLTFAPTNRPFILIDQETGSTWNVFSGQAIDGPLNGQQLSRIKSTSAFWFGWKDLFPQTLVYGQE